MLHSRYKHSAARNKGSSVLPHPSQWKKKLKLQKRTPQDNVPSLTAEKKEKTTAKLIQTYMLQGFLFFFRELKGHKFSALFCSIARLFKSQTRFFSFNSYYLWFLIGFLFKLIEISMVLWFLISFFFRAGKHTPSWETYAAYWGSAGKVVCID